MPTIGNNRQTLLHGLSDFWTRFYADIDELNALYQGTEVLLAQVYLNIVSSFLNISVAETPLFNKEYFKLLTIREDGILFDEGASSTVDRYVFDLPDNVVKTQVLQNKVIDPTASLEIESGYELDADEYQLRFEQDPTGRSLRQLGITYVGHLLAYGTGVLHKFYVTDGSTPFTKAKVGDWIQLSGSGSGNDYTYRIGQVVDAATLLLQGTMTLPEANSGTLQGTLLDAEFAALEGFAHRALDVICGGSFDDPTLRNSGSTEIGSWYANTPLGFGIRKGDILRVYDANAVPTIPRDFTIAVVRHDKLYISSTTPVPDGLTNVSDYVILREPNNTDITQESQLFTMTGIAKAGDLGSTEWDGAENSTVFTIDTLTPPGAKFEAADKFRYITITTGGPITWAGSVSADGELTWTGGAIQNPLARAFVNSRITVSGSTKGQDGTYTISSLTDSQNCVLNATFIAETGLSLKLEGVTNQGTYRVKKIISNEKIILSSEISYDDPLNGSIEWTIHEGYQASLAHSYLVDASVKLYAGAGNQYTGGLHEVVEGNEFSVDYKTGKITQIGYFAGTWGTSITVQISYNWLREVLSKNTTGVFDSTDTAMRVKEIAMWAPDISVDKYHLYQNYGYLIDRFEPSSESYREFIRGIFQLYILGPTLERIESALNVIAGLPVIRDDGEILVDYDDSDSEFDYLYTIRPDNTQAEYKFTKGAPIRTDITSWITGDAAITFESFEPLTTMFSVTDYVQDPTWWESIIIPEELMPTENTARRTTTPTLYENIIGQIDDPRIGDPGLFIGADDEGNVPANINLYPAKRRKMANVVMERFLKHHMFFIQFDPTIYSFFSGEVVEDLRELILIAKPSYKYVYIEPTSSFLDVMRIIEQPVDVDMTVPFSDTMLVGSQELTLQTGSWNLGEYWRFAPHVPNETLSWAGSYYQLAGTNIISLQLFKDGALDSSKVEWVDYWIDYRLGRIYTVAYPGTSGSVWSPGVYTAAYSSIVRTPEGSQDVSLGDTPFLVGGIDPALTRVRRREWITGAVTVEGSMAIFSDANAYFEAAVHEGQLLNIYSGASEGQWKIRRVKTDTSVILDNPAVPIGSNLRWSFPSEEPSDGVIAADNVFKTPSGMFLSYHKGHYIQIMDSGAGNDGMYKITEVVSMCEVVLSGSPTVESNVHWRLMNSKEEQMDLIERPVQITQTSV